MAFTDLLAHYLFPILLVPVVWYLSTFISSSAPSPKNRRGMKKEGEAEFVLQKIRVHPIKVMTFDLLLDRKSFEADSDFVFRRAVEV